MERLDTLVKLLEGSAVHVQALADNVLLVASADSAEELKSMTNPLFDTVAK